MSTEEKIFDRTHLQDQVELWKQSGQSVVFTNGCFDILHLGHVDYLEKAAKLGDKLVVALNTDASVSVLKGPSRPINSEYARQRLIAALAFVDAVTLFGEQTPLALIKSLTPNVLVKGKDYQVSEIVGADWVLEHGGKVETIELVEGFSTTALIKKAQG